MPAVISESCYSTSCIAPGFLGDFVDYQYSGTEETQRKPLHLLFDVQ